MTDATRLFLAGVSPCAALNLNPTPTMTSAVRLFLAGVSPCAACHMLGFCLNSTTKNNTYTCLVLTGTKPCTGRACGT